MIRNLVGNLEKPKDAACFQSKFWNHAVSLGLSRFAKKPGGKPGKTQGYGMFPEYILETCRIIRFIQVSYQVSCHVSYKFQV
jgi:hypothetical protein